MIYLTQGYVAWVDAVDFDELNKFKWIARAYSTERVYAQRSVQCGAGKKTTGMHSRILAPAVLVDHKVHLGAIGVVDNRRQNLRVVTRAQNAANYSKKAGRFSSPFKGVSRYPGGKWQSHIRAATFSKNLGIYTVEAYAAYAYDLAAVRIFGEFATTNFPVPGSASWMFGGAQ